jgi:type IV conjugative transfer system coupling protein TraD
MLNDFTGGGQIFLHTLQMFFQVLRRSLVTSMLISLAVVSFISYQPAQSLDLKAAMTYQKAMLADGLDNASRGIRRAINPKARYYFTRIDAYSKKGLDAKDMDPRRIIKSNFYRLAYLEAVDFFKMRILFTVLVMFGVFVLIYLIWSRFGRAAKEKKHLSGSLVKTPEEVSNYLKKMQKASIFNVGGIPLVKGSESKHILITGSTGSGKTNCLHTLLPQIRAQKQPAIVIDTEGDMVSRYWREGHDIIINPYDLRTHNWDLWSEINSGKCIRKIAASFFPDTPPDSYDHNQKWTSWGKMLFIGCLEYLRNENKMNIEDLYNLIHRESIEDLTAKLSNTSVGSLICGKSDNNAAPHNIRINTILATEWLEILSDSREKSFSFQKWFNRLDETRDDRWIFITCDGSDTKVLLPFFTVIADIALNSLISIGLNENRKVWFIFDELAKLKYLPALQENITLLRKYGGCILAATQSFNQIFAHYGRNSGSVMLGQFNTNIIFRISEVEEAKIIAKRIGEIEYLNQQRNISYGAHEFRDGVSYTEQEKKKDLVNVSDLNNLETHQAYILLPEPEIAIAKTKLSIAPKPKKLWLPFLDNPQIELMLKERLDNWNAKIPQQQDEEPKQKKRRNKKNDDAVKIFAKDLNKDD